MLLKRLSFIISFFLSSNLLAGDFLHNKPEIDRIQSILQKKEMQSDLSSFYDDLYNALNNYFVNNDKESLKILTAKSYITRSISKLLNYLTNKYHLFEDKIFDDKMIQIFDNKLGGLFEFKLFKFINYLMFISKIADAVLPQNNLESNLAIFSDDIFSNPLLIFLFIYYLKLSGYTSITLNLLTKSDSNYEALQSVIQNLGIDFKINRYQTISDLINSNNKIDVYLSDLSHHAEQNYYKCIRKMNINENESITYYLYVIYSSIANTSLFISTEIEDSQRMRLVNFIVEKLLKELVNTTKDTTKQTINDYDCVLKPSKEVTLADLIYRTASNVDKKSIPLFVYCYYIKDTGVGVRANNIIMETNITDFNTYEEILCSIFKTNIGLVQEDIEAHASRLVPFNYDPKTTNISLYKESLNHIKSTISTFLRNSKLLAPSEINVD